MVQSQHLAYTVTEINLLNKNESIYPLGIKSDRYFVATMLLKMFSETSINHVHGVAKYHLAYPKHDKSLLSWLYDPLQFEAATWYCFSNMLWMP